MTQIFLTYGRDDPDDQWTPLAFFYSKTEAIESDYGGWQFFRVTKGQLSNEEVVAEPLS